MKICYALCGRGGKHEACVVEVENMKQRKTTKIVVDRRENRELQRVTGEEHTKKETTRQGLKKKDKTKKEECFTSFIVAKKWRQPPPAKKKTKKRKQDSSSSLSVYRPLPTASMTYRSP